MKQVTSTKSKKKTTSTSKELLDLFEATKIATETGPVHNRWDEDLVTQVVDILETHLVR